MSHQNKNSSCCLNLLFPGIVVDDADGADGGEAEEEAVDEVPAVGDAEQRGAGGDVAEDQKEANPNGDNAGFSLK